MPEAVIDVRQLRTYFHTEDGVVRAVDDVSFRVEPGQTLGIVGESGSGKSVTSLSIMQLLASSAEIESGEIAFLGKDLVGIPEPEMRSIRGADISMIFQEPMTSLNPVFTAGAQVAEALVLHQGMSQKEARERTIELFDEVGIPEPESRVDSYPHQLSGGQKQRVMIAMALSCNPKLLIADEPTTALDVTIQAQILDILRKLRDERGMAILFITHDLGVIAEIADDVLVMYRGKLVEYGSVLSVFEQPKHPYTKGLLACRPRLDTPYRLLPTVSDFMQEEIDPETGEREVVELTLSDERLDQLKTQGRGRLLHPAGELEAMGHPHDPASAGDTTLVPDGTAPLLDVRDLQVHFPIRRGILSRTVGHVRAVDGVSFRVYRGQTLGLVGESGCGKTTTGRAILRLVEPTAGVVDYDGVDLAQLSGGQLREMRRKLQIIFQDPYGSLNPRMTIESTLTEPMAIHKLGSGRRDRRARAAARREGVDLTAHHHPRDPHPV
ncbi:MAG: ABC transporter ATP-binding protein, partial [Planctomycetota bacterium]